MVSPQPASSFPSLRLTKLLGDLAAVSFIVLALLTPNKGISWVGFFCTWGMMLVAAFVSFIGYFQCRNRGERISAFYAICPAMLFGAVLFFLNLHDIVRALLD